MQISSLNASVPVADVTPAPSNDTTTGFWALFANPDFPEPTPSSAPSASPAAPNGFEALFGNLHPQPAGPLPGPTGFEALFSNASFPAATAPPTGPTGFEALFGDAAKSVSIATPYLNGVDI